MKKRQVGFVSVTLGALGCGEPSGPYEPVQPGQIFTRDLTSEDSLKGAAWRRYLKAETLHAAWTPPSGSPWRPYYKPTLVAAVSVVQSAAMPIHTAEVAGDAAAAAFIASADLKDAAIFVDLAGEHSVAWGAALQRRGFQPVVTINNWPHQHGLIRLERPLGALLYYAEEASRSKPSEAAPPVFILDASRLAHRGATIAPDRFDNRYFHAPTDFPAMSVFRDRGIKRIIYVNARGTQAGSEEEDLNAYFVGLAAEGMAFTYVTPGTATPLATGVLPVARTTIFARQETNEYAGARPYGRSYQPYYHHFWSRSRGGWGGWSGASGSSSGSGSSGSRGFSS